MYYQVNASDAFFNDEQIFYRLLCSEANRFPRTLLSEKIRQSHILKPFGLLPQLCDDHNKSTRAGHNG